ncbi:MAG: hypothetical protein PHV83_04785 [Bacteroidales bacterium]|nr:hypothetical protein [Bacteroidales bacterium]
MDNILLVITQFITSCDNLSEDVDIIKVLIYWKDEEAQKKWHASKEHQQGHIDRHKQRKETGKEPLNRKALNMTFEDFDVVSTLEAE